MVPKIPTIAGNHSYENGQSIYLTCSVEAYPPPQIEWLFRDLTTGNIRLLLNTSRSLVHPTRSTFESGNPHTWNGMVINSVTSRSSGDYVCAVSTNGHPAFKRAVLSVTVSCKFWNILLYQDMYIMTPRLQRQMFVTGHPVSMVVYVYKP